MWNLIGVTGSAIALALIALAVAVPVEQPQFAAPADRILGRAEGEDIASELVTYHYVSNLRADPSEYVFDDNNPVSVARRSVQGDEVTLIFDEFKVLKQSEREAFRIEKATTTAEDWLGRKASRLFSIAFAQTTDTFSTTGFAAWTAPADVTQAKVACWGGGGGAGDGSNAGTGGAGGGAFASSTVSVTPGTQYTLFIGAGGNNGVSTSAGTSGATSTFATTTVIAAPGWFSPGCTLGVCDRGLGGAAASSTGDVVYSGGNGGFGDGATGDEGGGGGGAGGPHGNGVFGNNGVTTGGNGGAGTNGIGGAGGPGDTTDNDDVHGQNGTANTLGGGGGRGGDDLDSGGNGATYGGGGGGGETNATTGTGDGAAGACVITYTASGGGSAAPDDGVVIFG